MTSKDSAAGSMLIVGGGAIGSSVAYEAALRGHEVTLLDARTVGSRDACSYGSAGILCPSVASPLASRGMVLDGLHALAHRGDSFGIRPHRGLVGWLGRFTRSALQSRQYAVRSHAMTDLAMDSLRLHKEYDERGLKTSISQTGVLYLHDSQQSLGSSLRTSTDSEFRDELWSGEQLRHTYSFATDAIVGAVQRQWEASCDSGQYVAAVAAAAQSEGARFVEDTTARSLLVEHGVVRGVVTADGQTWRAEQIVIATGSGTRELLRSVGADLPLERGYGYHVEVERLPDDPDTALYLSGSHLIATPLAGRLRIAGGFYLNGPGGSSGPIPEAKVKRVLGEASHWIANLQQREVLSSWSGARPCLADGIPAVGSLPRHRNVIVATGHAMLGITLAPATGRLVAQLASGAPMPWYAHQLRPGRFAQAA